MVKPEPRHIRGLVHQGYSAAEAGRMLGVHRRTAARWAYHGRGALKGGQVQGERHPMAKLDRDDVRDIRRSDATLLELADEFGISESHVSRIRRRSRWRHLR